MGHHDNPYLTAILLTTNKEVALPVIDFGFLLSAPPVPMDTGYQVPVVKTLKL